MSVSTNEAIWRIKLSIDKQIAGDIPLSFGQTVSIEVMENIVVAVTERGSFIVHEDGSIDEVGLRKN